MKDYVEHYGRKCITCGYWRRGYLHRGDDLKVFEQRVNKCGCHGMNNPRYYNDEDLSAFDSCEFWIKEPNVLSKEEIDQEVQVAAEREKKIKNSSERAFSGGILRKEKQERQEYKQQKPVMIIIGASIIFVIIVGFILKNVSTEKNSTAVIHQNTITADFPKTMYSNAKAGLRMRAEPSIDSIRIRTSPYKEKIQILERSSTPVTIDGVTDYWYKTNAGFVFEGNYYKYAWVFGGYLSENSP